jgi:serine/threonine protein kinase
LLERNSWSQGCRRFHDWFSSTANLLVDDCHTQVRNEKARRFLSNMRKKPGVQLEQYFPKADKNALRLMRKLLAFDPADRPTAEEALADPYFAGLANPGREPAAQPVSKLAFDFERRKLTCDEVSTARGSAPSPASHD